MTARDARPVCGVSPQSRNDDSVVTHADAVTKVFLDTEYVDTGRLIVPISIALVAETGAEYYAVFAENDLRHIGGHPWLSQNVAPHLPIRSSGSSWMWDPRHPDFTAVKPQSTIAAEIVAFFSQLPGAEIWAYFSPFDTIVLTQLYGPFDELPHTIPRFIKDLMQEAIRIRRTVPQQSQPVHHALFDARHALTIAEAIGLVQPRIAVGDGATRATHLSAT
ncbi:3'-5' exoribonuclease [Actinoplanes sp. NPDC026619]|uniref:3'-5' exoribonuclease domain-containing protein n=1 Tax=Actinoplanes sp. NPDC026619 TaxID=3155798 RepID=UPI003405629E